MNRFLLVNMKALPCRVVAPAGLFTTENSRSTYYFFRIVFLTGFIFFTIGAVAQSNLTEQQKADYQKTISNRSAKIINNLSITDSVKYKKVQAIVASQYLLLADAQDRHTAAVADIKKQFTEKDKQADAIKTLDEKKAADLAQLHNHFIAQLNENLTAEQVDKIKDGMTYRVFPITYAAYIDEIPSLTTEQKDKIYAWLKEARELAMDAESSDKKHAVFGKYKGRINNYLSAAGYDMKKEGEAWQKRLQAAKEAKQTQN